ncbi:MAG: hypothetical protein KDK90_27350 [Leptospiraceae bacterium]|nr:hypothetical protein [Leptospiraceae bacterium]
MSVTLNASTWMHDNMNIIGNFNLRNLCMLGTHDSGMCKNVDGTIAPDCAVITQRKNILEQLQLGVRYFDIRPIIGGGKYHTGHYSNTSVGWLGGRGQSIEDIISEINFFCQNTAELLVLSLSHAYDTDNGYKNFNQNQWNGLFNELSKLKHLYIIGNNSNEDLTIIKLNKILIGKPSIIIVVRENTSLGDYACKGFYNASQYSLYDS